MNDPFGAKERARKKKEAEGVPCKGLVFRGSVSRCITSHNGIMERRELRLLKRRSCKGCAKCSWIMDWMQEELSGIDRDAPFIGDIQHGKMYKPHFVVTRDWESSYDEIDYVEFVIVEDTQ